MYITHKDIHTYTTNIHTQITVISKNLVVIVTRYIDMYMYYVTSCD